jgi:F-type H+-transporting ATPase subunit b
MDAALQKVLGELLLNAVPTIILFAIVWMAYKLLVHDPLLRVRAERHSKTEGAIATAQQNIAAADAKTAEYEQKLREARAEVFRRQEARRKTVLEARSAAIAQAREQASVKIKAAKADIEKDAATAKVTLQQQAESLATDVIRAVLRAGAASPAAGR